MSPFGFPYRTVCFSCSYEQYLSPYLDSPYNNQVENGIKSNISLSCHFESASAVQRSTTKLPLVYLCCTHPLVERWEKFCCIVVKKTHDCYCYFNLDYFPTGSCISTITVAGLFHGEV